MSYLTTTGNPVMLTFAEIVALHQLAMHEKVRCLRQDNVVLVEYAEKHDGTLDEQRILYHTSWIFIYTQAATNAKGEPLYTKIDQIDDEETFEALKLSFKDFEILNHPKGPAHDTPT